MLIIAKIGSLGIFWHFRGLWKKFMC